MNKSDIILILSVFAAALIIFAVNALNSTASAPYALITWGGEVRCVDLRKDTTFGIEQGEMINTITVENNTIRVSGANCTTGSCVRQGAISKKNQVIVCLPHKLMIEIRSSGSSGNTGEEAEYDAVSG